MSPRGDARDGGDARHDAGRGRRRRSRSTRCSTGGRSASTCCKSAAGLRARSTAPKTSWRTFARSSASAILQTTADGLFSYEEVECLAACDRATCMQVNLEFVYDLTPAKIDEMLDAMRAGTYAVAPMAQTEAPAARGRVRQDEQIATGRKSPGAIGVDESEQCRRRRRHERHDHARPHHQRATSSVLPKARRERAVVDSRAVVEAVDEAGAAMPVTKVLTAGIGEARSARHRRLSPARRIRAVGARRARAQAGRRARSRREVGVARPRRRRASRPAKSGRSCRPTSTLRYLVCNCDEAEPGHVQGPHAARRGAASGARGHADRRLRHRAATTRSSISAASSSAATRSSARRSKQARAAGLRRQEHLRQRITISR